MVDWGRIYSEDNNKGLGYAPESASVYEVFEDLMSEEGSEAVLAPYGTDVAVVSREGRGWTIIGGDSTRQNAWCVDVSETDRRVGDY